MLLLVVVLISYVDICHATKLVASFLSGQSSTQFQTMIRDPRSGHIYIGATNKLYHLSDQLALIQEIPTGPQNDSIYCPPPNEPCVCPLNDTNLEECKKYNKTLTKSYTKALVIDTGKNNLIHCSTLFHGFCEIISTSDMTNRQPVYDSLVSPDKDVPVIMLIAPGPGGTTNLYIASSWSDKSRYSNSSWADIPLVAGRDIGQKLAIAKKDHRQETSIRMKEDFKKNQFVVLYRFGFSFEGFSYFLTVQQNGKEYESRMVRICQNDQWFNSYTEIKLNCGDSSGEAGSILYNIVTAAHLGRIGGDLAKQLGLAAGDMGLYATFAQGYEESYETMASSALCVYSMKMVEEKFDALVKDCFKGNSRARIGPQHIADTKKCQSLTVVSVLHLVQSE